MLLVMSGAAAFAQRIVVKGTDFTSTTFLSEQELKDTRQSGYIRGFGMADFAVTVPQTGWYELWVQASPSATDIYLDGVYLINTPFASGVWTPKENAEKVVNLYLTQGKHTLRFDHSWPWGIPWMNRFFLEPAKDVTGMVRLSPVKDYLVFRKGEAFPVQLQAGRQPQAYALTFTVSDVNTGKTVHTLQRQIAAGDGVSVETLFIPTDREGTFDLKAWDAQGNAVERVMQYLVIDTKQRPVPTAKVEKELIATIDCSKQAPDYVSSGGTRSITATFGNYLEGGTKGRVEDLDNADWFAYTLHLPSIQDTYEAEVEYPDDDLRTFLISMVDDVPNPYAPTLGVRSGGEFPLTNKMQTQELYFYPRRNDPRLFFQGWYRGQRAAVSRIRIYRITGNLPVLATGKRGGRQFGFYQEEPLRFTSYWGAMPDGNTFTNINRPADRLGQWANYLGANLWHPTIEVYQSMMWPSKVLQGQSLSDTDGYGILGPPTLKEPLKKDLVRLMLLNCEKYGMDFIGEMHLPVNWVLARDLDRRFGGKGTFEDDSPAKPWLSVGKDGKVDTCLYNALYPGVQDFIASVIQEVADRYKDSPAFKGLDLRLMAWQFSAWQCLPSIYWGYEDYTVAQFSKETGIAVPVANDDPQRFTKRYDWLMAHAYQPWVDWRCRKVHQYHQRLAAILTKARPDLALHLDAYGPTYDIKFSRDVDFKAYERLGWAGLIRESGIDPALYRQDRNIILNETRVYPPGGRSMDPVLEARGWDQSSDQQAIDGAAKPVTGGTVSYVHFDANSYEGEMVRVEDLGLGKKSQFHNSETVHGAGVINPAGRHALSRFANTLADGNIVYITDGSHGYAQGQPQYLRDFLAEYLSLPAIGMTRLAGADDPVALWSGQQQGLTYFYLVNRAPYAVDVTVRFSARPTLKRLVTGQVVAVSADKSIRLSLNSYQLLTFSATGGVPTSVVTTVPAAVKTQLQGQLAFVGELLAGKGAAANVTLVPFSLVDQQHAEKKLAEARAACTAGRYVAARRALLHNHLMTVYEAFGAYPPELLYRKAPKQPDLAFTPDALLAKLDPAGREIASIVPTAKIAAALPGEQVLAWQGASLTIGQETPIPNRFRISLAYLTQKPYARPTILVDGQVIPGQQVKAVQENRLWGQLTLLSTVTLRQGAHRVEMRPQPGARVGVFYLKIDPVYHDLATNAWMVIGPFSGTDTNDEKIGMAKVNPPELTRDFTASYPGDAGKMVSWRHADTTESYVNLHTLTGSYNWRVGYAVTTIESPENRTAELKFGVDYWARIWLNGEKVYEQKDGHGPPRPAQFTIPVQLKKGSNELLLKIHAGSSGNGFWCGISDPGDLRVAPK
jgi:hypothetical protein